MTRQQCDKFLDVWFDRQPDETLEQAMERRLQLRRQQMDTRPIIAALDELLAKVKL